MGALRPDAYFANVTDIEARLLVSRGIKAVLLDSDNTILPRDADKVPAAQLAWIEELKAAGIVICLLTNSTSERGVHAAEQAGVPLVSGALKPFVRGFREAMRLVDAMPNETLMVGDQSYTDILGAHRAGLRAALVDPLSDTDLWYTSLLRVFDRHATKGMVKIKRN